MKKFAILTSVLALTACGGGSGGGAGPIAQPVDITTSNSRVSAVAANSKYQATRYVANKLGEDANSVGLAHKASTRGAFTPSVATGNIDYDTAKELVELATWLADENTTKSEIMDMFNKSKTDKNKIKASLKLMDDMYCFVGGDAEETAERILSHRSGFLASLAELQEKTEVFDLRDVVFTMAAASGSGGDEGGAKDELTFEVDSKGKISGIKHKAYISNNGVLEQEEDSTAVFKRIGDTNVFRVHQNNGEGKDYTGTGTVVTYGSTVGLKYSDFGQLVGKLVAVNPDGTKQTERSFEPFAGGYNEESGLKKVKPETSMNFEGMAVGSVSNNNIDKNISGPASLAFAGGTETLSLEFSKANIKDQNDIKWYDVTIVRNGTSGNTIEFSKANLSDGDIPENLQFNDFVGESDTRTPTYNLVDGYNGEGLGHEKMPGKGDGKLEIGYYGKGNAVTEATGVTQYVESLGSEQAGEIRMNVGFGMVKKD